MEEIFSWEYMWIEYKVKKHPTFWSLCWYINIVAWDEDIDVHWWVSYQKDWRTGFDCAHLWDFVPSRPEMWWIYRDLDFVKQQCKSAILQRKNKW